MKSLILYLILLTSFLYAQPELGDSLLYWRQRASVAETDKQKLYAYQNLSRYYEGVQYDSMYVYALKSQIIALKTKDYSAYYFSVKQSQISGITAMQNKEILSQICSAAINLANALGDSINVLRMKSLDANLSIQKGDRLLAYEMLQNILIQKCIEKDTLLTLENLNRIALLASSEEAKLYTLKYCELANLYKKSVPHIIRSTYLVANEYKSPSVKKRFYRRCKYTVIKNNLKAMRFFYDFADADNAKSLEKMSIIIKKAHKIGYKQFIMNGYIALYDIIDDTRKESVFNDAMLYFSYSPYYAKISLLQRQKKRFENDKRLNEAFQLGRILDSLQKNSQDQQTQDQLHALEMKHERQSSQLENEKKERILSEQKNKQKILLGLLLLAVLLGGFLYYRNRYLQRSQEIELLKTSILAEENERKRLAKELHDGLGGLLSLSHLQLNQTQLESLNIDQLKTLNIQAITELRQISHNLMPHTLEQKGLKEAVNEYVDSLKRSVKEVQLDFFDLDENKLSKLLQTNVYRILQELCNNILKHAQANKISIQIFQSEDNLSLSIEDNGIGISSDKQTQGIGIQNLQQRVADLKGEMEISGSENGTGIYIHFPLT